jgi:cell wall assembly regulator SMI1
MHLEDVARHLERRAQQRGLRYALGLPAPPEAITAAEARLGVILPAQVARFYGHYDGLRVEEPPLEVLPLARLAFVAPQHLHFATVARQHHLCFDVTRPNDAGQWAIVALAEGVQVTLTMASFWSNKLWAWLDQGRAIWRPEPVTEG